MFRSRIRRAYTLVELLVVVTVLGIAGALIAPSFGSTDVLRVQGAIRTLVADLTVAQSDAIALQRGRAIIFYPEEHRYVVVEVNGSTLDPELDRIEERQLNIEQFGWCKIDSVNFPNNVLIFDALGGPVDAPGSSSAAPEGWVDLSGSQQRFRLRVEAYTGRVVIERLADIEPLPGGGGGGGGGNGGEDGGEENP